MAENGRKNEDALVLAHAASRNDSQETIQAPDEPGAYSMCCDAERNHAEVKSGAEGIRTLDLSIANATLSQLSYRPPVQDILKGRCEAVQATPNSRAMRLLAA